MVAGLLVEPQLLNAGIPRRAWDCTLRSLRSDVRDKCRAYTARFAEHRKKGTGVLLFGDDTATRYTAYYAMLKAIMAQGFRVWSGTVLQLTEMYFHQRAALQEIVESADVVGIAELNLPRELSNAGTVQAVVWTVTARCNDCLPIVACSSLEMEFTQDGLAVRYGGIGILDRCTQLVCTDEQPPESAWLSKRRKESVC